MPCAATLTRSAVCEHGPSNVLIQDNGSLVEIQSFRCGNYTLEIHSDEGRCQAFLVQSVKLRKKSSFLQEMTVCTF